MRDNTLNSSFGGWQTKIYHNIFNYIKQNVFLRGSANTGGGLYVFGNYGWHYCGSNDLNNGSAYEVVGVSYNTFSGNVIGGAYPFGVRTIGA